MPSLKMSAKLLKRSLHAASTSADRMHRELTARPRRVSNQQLAQYAKGLSAELRRMCGEVEAVRRRVPVKYNHYAIRLDPRFTRALLVHLELDTDSFPHLTASIVSSRINTVLYKLLRARPGWEEGLRATMPHVAIGPKTTSWGWNSIFHACKHAGKGSPQHPADAVLLAELRGEGEKLAALQIQPHSLSH